MLRFCLCATFREEAMSGSCDHLVARQDHVQPLPGGTLGSIAVPPETTGCEVRATAHRVKAIRPLFPAYMAEPIKRKDIPNIPAAVEAMGLEAAKHVEDRVANLTFEKVCLDLVPVSSCTQKFQYSLQKFLIFTPP